MDMKNTRNTKARNLRLGKKMVRAMACNKDKGKALSACYLGEDLLAVTIPPNRQTAVVRGHFAMLPLRRGGNLDVSSINIHDMYLYT